MNLSEFGNIDSHKRFCQSCSGSDNKDSVEKITEDIEL